VSSWGFSSGAAVGGFSHHLHVAAVFHQAAQTGPDNVVMELYEVVK